jgi:hypothetical protein
MFLNIMFLNQDKEFTFRSQKNMPLYHSILTKFYEAITVEGSVQPNILILGLV